MTKYQIIKKYIDELNYYGLHDIAPDDEFDSYSRQLADQIGENDTAEIIAMKIANLMDPSFGNKVQPEKYLNIAKKMKTALKNESAATADMSHNLTNITQNAKNNDTNHNVAPSPDLSLSIAGVPFKNPVMPASGCFGSGMEYSEYVDLNSLGAVVTKGVSVTPWEGNPVPRTAETYGGMLNAIGLQNPGLDLFIKRDLDYLKDFDTNVIVNVCGHTEEEYLEAVERLSDEARVDMLEINVSCPNVKEGAIAFGKDPKVLESLTRNIRAHSKKPVIIKLTPNVSDITETAKAAEQGGADALSLINTLLGMKIDVERRSFLLANKTGGLSGPAIHPVAVRMVYEVAHAVPLPIIGMGGIRTWEDAAEFLLAGASAVAIGTATFHDPTTLTAVIEGLREYMVRKGLRKITDICLIQ